jgi:small subunit ribosomal protein S7
MRKGNAVPRSILPDPKFNDLNIAKLINMIMLQGKKGLAQRIVYGAFDKVAEKTKKDPYTIFTKAMENVGPSVELKTKRVRGSNFKVPMEVGLKRRTVLSLR